MKALKALTALTAVALLAACATRSDHVAPLATDPAEFFTWECGRIDDELDAVQHRAADLAWAVDEHSGNNIVALGLGVTVFWPALLAMRPEGLEAADLARLKGRDEALRVAARQKACPPAGIDLPPGRASALPVALGERLVYEVRRPPQKEAGEWSLRVTALRRTEIEYAAEPSAEAAARSITHGEPGARFTQDRVGNLVVAPAGALQWPRLLRGELALGQVTNGDIVISGDPLARARMRGQVVAVGPQTLAGRRFDAIVIELFGDAAVAETWTRLDGVMVVDRASGVLLRLDLRSAQPSFSLQRRLLRVEAAPP